MNKILCALLIGTFLANPVYAKENNAEISLLDGVDAKDIQGPLGK